MQLLRNGRLRGGYFLLYSGSIPLFRLVGHDY
jgi:hypothetical protein